MSRLSRGKAQPRQALVTSVGLTIKGGIDVQAKVLLAANHISGAKKRPLPTMGYFPPPKKRLND